jgi:hypothetical protein
VPAVAVGLEWAQREIVDIDTDIGPDPEYDKNGSKKKKGWRQYIGIVSGILSSICFSIVLCKEF